MKNRRTSNSHSKVPAPHQQSAGQWTIGGRQIHFQPPVRRWLVVDDDRSMRLVMQRLLCTIRVDCDVAMDGSEAWQLLRRNLYAGVITDVDMPRCSGLQLLDRIRKCSVVGIAVLPVLVISSRENLGPMIAGDPDDRTRFLPKPVDIRSLAAFIQQSWAPVSRGRCQF